jgi:hypothetical protein
MAEKRKHSQPHPPSDGSPASTSPQDDSGTVENYPRKRIAIAASTFATHAIENVLLTISSVMSAASGRLDAMHGSQLVSHHFSDFVIQFVNHVSPAVSVLNWGSSVLTESQLSAIGLKLQVHSPRHWPFWKDDC